MTKLGKPLWDDPAHVLGTIEPDAANSYDVGTVNAPFSNLSLTGGIQIQAGTDQYIGTELLVNGDTTVATNKVQADSIIFLSRINVGVQTPGLLYANPANIVPGVSFKVESTEPLDDSSFAWWIINPL